MWNLPMDAITAAYDDDIQVIYSPCRSLSRSITRRAHNIVHIIVYAQGLPIRLGLKTRQLHDGQIADTLLYRIGLNTIALDQVAAAVE